MANFESAVKVILKHEGGLADDAADPGGITNYGISFRFIQQEDLDLDNDGDIDGDDIRYLTQEQACQIYKEFFWDPYGYEDIADDTVATKIFDICVNAGPKRAHILTQEALTKLGHKVTVDGDLGPKSKAAIANSNPTKLVEAICLAQKGFYERLTDKKPSLAKFLPGWLKRAKWPFKTMPQG